MSRPRRVDSAAGGAAAIAVGVGGAAMAVDADPSDPAGLVFVENDRTVTPEETDAGSAERWDCPEKDGAAGPSAESPDPAL